MHSLKILTRNEIQSVLADLKHKGQHSRCARQNLILFRLATCCGLRVQEIVGLKIGNLKLMSERPHIEVPAVIAKGKKSRIVPLWWDAATLADLDTWKAMRIDDGADANSPVLPSRVGKMARRTAQERWETCVKVLGPERVEQLSIHCGRHSFCSHAIAGGRSLPEVRDAAGHSNIQTTSIYLHSVPDDGKVGALFSFAGT